MKTLLVANRGEIACRIFRTAARMGIRTVAVYSEPDRDAVHVGCADAAIPLGGSSASESYLSIEAILRACAASGADTVHPGYGFLSENALFAQAVVDAGLTWVGPTPANIAAMGTKIEAKRLAVAAGVATLASASIIGSDVESWQSAASSIGYPVLVKASAGGGGKGMRIVAFAPELEEAIVSARREAASSFGDGTVFIERYLAAPRHIEIQVFADTHGHAVYLHERECSIQRRHQKIVEEAPSSAVSPELRARMGAASVALIRSIGYVGAGTVEYLLDDTTGSFAFLEMNTRLQVEHPVTECITGTDLVRWQLLVADGAPLPLTQDQIELRGHAIEVRLYAEDPANDFLPTYGTLSCYSHLGPDGGLRFDDGVTSGSTVSTFYDPMLSKVIAHAPSRTEAALRLTSALRSSSIHGVTTNRDYLVGVLTSPDFLAGATTTTFVDSHPRLLSPAPVDPVHAIAGALVGSVQRRRCDRLWNFAPSGWRNVPTDRQRMVYDSATVAYSVRPDQSFVARVDETETSGRILSIVEPTSTTADIVIEVDGIARRCHVSIDGARTWVNSPAGQTDLVELPRFPDTSLAAASAGPTAPVPGRVVAVNVAVGDVVEAGQVLVVMEAMKMEHKIRAGGPATVTAVRCAVGDQVDAHQVLVALEVVGGS